MFRHHPANARQDLPQIGEIDRAKRLPVRRREFQHHEPGTRLEYPRRSRSPASRSIRLRTPKPTLAPSKTPSANGNRKASAATRSDARRLPRPTTQHRRHGNRRPRRDRESQRDCPARRQGQACQRKDPGNCPRRTPPHLVDRHPAPAPIGVERQQVIEQVVARRDVGEDAPHTSRFAAPPVTGSGPSMMVMEPKSYHRAWGMWGGIGNRRRCKSHGPCPMPQATTHDQPHTGRGALRKSSATRPAAARRRSRADPPSTSARSSR